MYRDVVLLINIIAVFTFCCYDSLLSCCWLPKTSANAIALSGLKGYLCS